MHSSPGWRGAFETELVLLARKITVRWKYSVFYVFFFEPR